MPGVGPAVPQQCPETGANFLMGGPFWADPIHNMDWVHGILESVKVRLGSCCCCKQGLDGSCSSAMAGPRPLLSLYTFSPVFESVKVKMHGWRYCLLFTNVGMIAIASCRQHFHQSMHYCGNLIAW